MNYIPIRAGFNKLVYESYFVKWTTFILVYINLSDQRITSLKRKLKNAFLETIYIPYF